MTTPKQETFKVTLTKPLTYAGKSYVAGDKIAVTAPERDWLAARNRINTATAPKETSK